MIAKESKRTYKTGLLIATYNNENTVADVAREALQRVKEVYVVNDGSTDGTLESLKAVDGIHLLSYPKHRGKGYALKTGFAAMIKDGFDYVLTLDADKQHKMEDIPTLLACSAQHPGALIVGVRNVKTQEGMPGKNSFANQFSNFWFKLETGIDLADTQCGLRIYPLQKLKGIHFYGTKYEFELEVLVRSAWKGIELFPQKVNVYYPPKEERVSHFRPFQDFSRISILNTLLVTVALLYIKPRDLLRQFTWEGIKQYLRNNVTHAVQSNKNLAVSAGLGIMFGILPIWGFQILSLLAISHLLKLNKVVCITLSNISLPIFIPFIIYGSYRAGGWITGNSYIPSLHQISLETVAQASFQYVVGAILLAIVAGLVTTLLTYGILNVCRRGR